MLFAPYALAVSPVVVAPDPTAVALPLGALMIPPPAAKSPAAAGPASSAANTAMLAAKTSPFSAQPEIALLADSRACWSREQKRRPPDRSEFVLPGATTSSSARLKRSMLHRKHVPAPPGLGQRESLTD